MDVSLSTAMLGIEQSYYRGALSLLRYVEHRAGTRRRFGAEADATWRQFKGELGTSERIQLLLADAHAQWPGAVGASNVCSLPGVSEDDAFGPDWEPLSGREAETVWRDVMKASAPESVEAALCAIAAAWGVKLESHAIGNLSPSMKVVVAGPSATAALINAFFRNTDLDWSRQVVAAIATPPAHRQLAAAAGVLLNLTTPVPLIENTVEQPRVAGATKCVSTDADAGDAALAAKLAG